MRAFGIERCFVPIHHAFELCWPEFNDKFIVKAYDANGVLTYYDKHTYDKIAYYVAQDRIAKLSNTWKLINPKAKFHPGIPNESDHHNIFDIGVVEWPSPILKSMRGAKVWFNTTERWAKFCGITAFHENWPGAGGGHIHVDAGPDKNLAFNVMTQSRLHPYVFWACITANDNINAQVIPKVPVIGKSTTHRGALQYRNELNTLEWRAWDSAATWEIQQLQLKLTHRFIEYLYKNPCDVTTPDIQKAHTYYAGHVKRCVKAFKTLVEMLGLCWDDYEWLIARNLVPRFTDTKYQITAYQAMLMGAN
jgi:hypothetical protein